MTSSVRLTPRRHLAIARALRPGAPEVAPVFSFAIFGWFGSSILIVGVIVLSAALGTALGALWYWMVGQ